MTSSYKQGNINSLIYHDIYLKTFGKTHCKTFSTDIYGMWNEFEGSQLMIFRNDFVVVEFRVFNSLPSLESVASRFFKN